MIGWCVRCPSGDIPARWLRERTVTLDTQRSRLAALVPPTGWEVPLVSADCFVCQKHASGGAVVGGVIFEDTLTYVGHILPSDLTDVYLGYLMVEPKRHVTGLGELTEDEAAALGRLVNDVARALRDVEGAEHIYSFVFGDAVPHLHVHVVPRYPGTPREYWGVRIDEWPGTPRGGAAEIAEISDRLRVGLASIRETRRSEA
jgi:histidine triad (HIT) family protein